MDTFKSHVRQLLHVYSPILPQRIYRTFSDASFTSDSPISPPGAWGKGHSVDTEQAVLPIAGEVNTRSSSGSDPNGSTPKSGDTWTWPDAEKRLRAAFNRGGISEWAERAQVELEAEVDQERKKRGL